MCDDSQNSHAALYNLTVKWRIINTKAGVILPFMVAGNAISFRQFSTSLPVDLMDAGRIDGATEYSIYFSYGTSMKPAFGAMTILLAMMSWNMFVWPLIVLREAGILPFPSAGIPLDSLAIIMPC